jgi:hypothetical protein
MAAACQKALGDLATEAVGTSTASPSPVPSVKIAVTGANQDAWTWIKQVEVGISEGECERVTVHVNGKEFDTQPEGEFFVAEIRLSEGENQVSAACLQPGGGEVQSDPVIYTGRLRQVPTAVIQIALEGGQVVLDGSESLPAEDGSEIAEYIWSAREDNPAPLQLQDGELTGEVSSPSMAIVPPTVDGEYYLSLRVKDDAGREDTSTIYFVVEEGQPRIPDYDGSSCTSARHPRPDGFRSKSYFGYTSLLCGCAAARS